MATRFGAIVKRRYQTHKQHLIYLWTWAWLFLVSAGWLWIYFEAVAVTGELFSENEVTSSIRETLSGTMLGNILEWVGAVLLWWRVVKVVVLHGAPFAWGRKFTSGRIGRTSRPDMGVTLTYLGDFIFLKKKQKNRAVSYEKSNLLFGAILRPHPRSEKLVRSRLEYLLLALPFRVVLLVTESKIKFAIASPAERAELFDEHADRFDKR